MFDDRYHPVIHAYDTAISCRMLELDGKQRYIVITHLSFSYENPVIINETINSFHSITINELITNSLKHAFPDKRKGTISLSFRQQRNKSYLLTVSDDGVGMPRGVEISNTKTLGMQLITVLVGQLGGTLKVQRKEGTSFVIKFKEYHEAGSVLY